MQNALFQAICRTGIFMICAQAIAHFRPNESYEKYIKLLVSVMILIQLFLPIGAFLAGVDNSSGTVRMNEFRESLEQSMEEARRQAAETEVLLEQMTLEEVRRRMEEQAMQGQQVTEEQAMQGQQVTEEQTMQEQQASRAAQEQQTALTSQKQEAAWEGDSKEQVGAGLTEDIEPVKLTDIDVEIAPVGSVLEE